MRNGPSHPVRFWDVPENAAKEGAPNPDVDWKMWLGADARGRLLQELAASPLDKSVEYVYPDAPADEQPQQHQDDGEKSRGRPPGRTRNHLDVVDCPRHEQEAVRLREMRPATPVLDIHHAHARHLHDTVPFDPVLRNRHGIEVDRNSDAPAIKNELETSADILPDCLNNTPNTDQATVILRLDLTLALLGKHDFVGVDINGGIRCRRRNRLLASSGGRKVDPENIRLRESGNPYAQSGFRHRPRFRKLRPNDAAAPLAHKKAIAVPDGQHFADNTPPAQGGDVGCGSMVDVLQRRRGERIRRRTVNPNGRGRSEFQMRADEHALGGVMRELELSQ